MPTYDYECGACARTFEQFQRITDPPLSACPTCSGPVQRLIGAGAGILFKGSGFYQTDYRSASYKKAQEKESAPSSEPAKSAQSTDTSSTSASSSTTAPKP